MGKKITNMQKFLCFCYFGSDEDHGLFQLSRERWLQCQDFVTKCRNFSEVDTVLLLQLRKMPCNNKMLGVITDAILRNSEDKVDIYELLPVKDTDSAYQKVAELRYSILEKQRSDEISSILDDDWLPVSVGNDTGSYPDDDFEMYKKKNHKELLGLACAEKYFPDLESLRVNCNALVEDVEDELELRESDAKKELEKYGLKLGVDVKEEEMFDRKVIRKAIKKKMAETLGFDVGSIADEDLKDPKKLRKKITEKLKQDMAKVTDLEDVDRLCAVYTSAAGCDLMNGFLRGDLRLKDTDKSSQAASWMTDLRVEIPTFLSVAEKALKLKYILYGKALEEQKVYRGVSVAKVISSVANDSKGKASALEEIIINRKWGSVKDKGFIYKSKDITSTSTEKYVAEKHAERTGRFFMRGVRGIVMEIQINPGTAFGIDFKKINLSGEGDDEIILKPKQKIRINRIKEKGGFIWLECETIRG